MQTAKRYSPFGARRKNPFVFHRFFEMGLEESASPFLSPKARKISQNLPLKASVFAALLLLISYLLSNSSYEPLSQVLLIAVYIIVGSPSLIDSIDDVVFKKDINIDVLMTLAAFSAYFLGAGIEGALLLVLFAISGALEDTVTLKAKNTLSSIHALAPTKAYVLDYKDYATERAVEDVEIGATVLVRAGEIVPLDGIVLAGGSFVSLAHLTGESLPVNKRVGDEVAGGGRVMEGSLTLKVLRTSADSTVSRIIKLVTQAQEAKPKLERWFDRFSRVYAVTIISLSLFFTLFFAHVMGLAYLGPSGAVMRSLSFLITASPCALILAVPIAYLSSLGVSAKKGIILKGGVIFDDLNACSMIAFDKTGTLTLGELVFDSIDTLNEDVSKEAYLTLAASLERNAVHPIAKAIYKEAEKANLPLFSVTDVKVIPGYGVEGRCLVDGKEMALFMGDVKALSERLAPEMASLLLARVQKRQALGQIVACGIFGTSAALFYFEDRPRPDVNQMLERIKKTGRSIVMLTGDHEESASQIARLVGITEYHSALLPEDKLNMISQFSASRGLAMVGDGVNDAPALARATVGICMGKVGSASAQEVADVILLNDNIELLDWLFQKAAQTRRVVRQNLAIAMSAIIFASTASLYGIVPLWLAVVLHEGGTLLVGLNALRLLRDKHD